MVHLKSVIQLKSRINFPGMMRVALFLGMGVLLAACAAQPGTTSSPNSTATTGQAAANPTSPAANAPTATSGGSSSASVSFSNDVEPIFQSRCVNCHGGAHTQYGLNLTSYNNVMTSGKDAPVIVAGNPDKSYLIQMVVSGKMPKSGPHLLPGQIQILTEWVQEGAPNN